MKVAVLGASGNVGRRVVRWLLEDGRDRLQEVVLVHRRVIADGSFPQDDDRLVQHIADMSSSGAFEAACTPLLRGVDVVICTMGVGSGKGPAALFRQVDVDLPTAFARAAASNGVRRAVLLTGVCANVDSTSSWLVGGAAEGKFFHFKGLVEKQFAAAGFPDGVAIFRPAVLLGTNHAPAFLNWFLPIIDWLFPARFRSIHIDQLARAIARVAIDAPSTEDATELTGGAAIFEGKRLFELVSGARWQSSAPARDR